MGNIHELYDAHQLTEEQMRAAVYDLVFEAIVPAESDMESEAVQEAIAYWEQVLDYYLANSDTRIAVAEVLGIAPTLLDADLFDLHNYIRASLGDSANKQSAKGYFMNREQMREKRVAQVKATIWFKGLAESFGLTQAGDLIDHANLELTPDETEAADLFMSMFDLNIMEEGVFEQARVHIKVLCNKAPETDIFSFQLYLSNCKRIILGIEQRMQLQGQEV